MDFPLKISEVFFSPPLSGLSYHILMPTSRCKHERIPSFKLTVVKYTTERNLQNRLRALNGQSRFNVKSQRAPGETTEDHSPNCKLIDSTHSSGSPVVHHATLSIEINVLWGSRKLTSSSSVRRLSEKIQNEKASIN